MGKVTGPPTPFLSTWLMLSRGPVPAPPEYIALKVIAEAIPGEPGPARRAIRRLCGLQGPPTVALAVIAVVLAKTELVHRRQVHGSTADRDGAEGRRTRALVALDDAATEAGKWAFYSEDRPLREAIGALLPLVRQAGYFASPKPKGGHPGLAGRDSLLQRFRDLGAKDREARAIVSAVKGLPFDIPEP